MESEKIFRVFTDSGGNFIDTANNYTNGTSKKFVGEFVSSDRDRYVIATKYSLSTRKNDQMKRLDEATKIELGFPHEFLKNDHVRELIFVDTFQLIDNHRA